jgi:hypothetical protein
MNFNERIAAVLKNCDRNGYDFAGSLIRDMRQQQADEIQKLKEALRQTRDQLEQSRRAGQISEDFRKNPENRQWATSYTKSVFDRVGAIRASQLTDPDALEALVAARNLLQDYHESQHIVYEQRDAARVDAAHQTERKAYWIGIANKLGAQLDKVREFVK